MRPMRQVRGPSITKPKCSQPGYSQSPESVFTFARICMWSGTIVLSNTNGARNKPSVFCVFDSIRSRYHSAADMQKYAGVAPVIEQSGKKSWTHWRYSCPKFYKTNLCRVRRSVSTGFVLGKSLLPATNRQGKIAQYSHKIASV